MSDIPSEQVLPANLRLLHARQQFWDIAVRWQVAQFIIVVLVPLAGAVTSVVYPEPRGIIGAVAVGVTLLDVAFLDRQYRQAIKTAAKASEQFDAAVLRLPWNSLSAGEPLSPEETDAAVRKWRKKHANEPNEGWYSGAVARVPLHVARVICQRTNVTYDSALRRNYAGILLTVALFITVAILIIGFVRSTRFDELVMSSLVPVSPLLIWSVREYLRQDDAAVANDAIRAEAEAVLEDVIAGNCDEPTCTSHGVRLQSALFTRRSTNALVFPGLYKIRRGKLEQDMHAGAEYWVERALRQ